MQLQALVSDSHFIHGCPHASRPCPVLANASHLAVPVPLDIWRWTHLCSREKKKPTYTCLVHIVPFHTIAKRQGGFPPQPCQRLTHAQG